MPQERENPFPFPTAAEAQSASGDRVTKAARNIVSRRIEGIPKRSYIMGDCDDAPVVKGVRDLVSVCYDLLDDLQLSSEGGELQSRSAARLKVLLEEHRCPKGPEV